MTSELARALHSEIPTLDRVADAAPWMYIPPAQFDREFPWGNPFVIKDLDLYSEEDLESTSYVEIDLCALNRISIIWWMVEQALFPALSIRDIHRDIIWGVLVDLFEDGRIWLWADGDEQMCTDSYLDAYLHSKESLDYVKRDLSGSSLRLRTPRIPTWSCFRERVSNTSFAMRFSVISWAVYTSVVVREAGWVRGCADWTRCGLLDTVRKWYRVVGDIHSAHILGDDATRQSYEVVFKYGLKGYAHSCMSSGVWQEYDLRPWLHLQSFLRSTPSFIAVSMTLLVTKQSYCQDCWICKKLSQLYTDSRTADYVGPSLSLVVLNHQRVHCNVDILAWQGILLLGVSRGIISDDILTRMDDHIRMLHKGGKVLRSQFVYNDRFDFHYQPWVNTLPGFLQGSVTTCSESQWREVEHAVRKVNQHKAFPRSHWHSIDIGLGVRITAVYLLMSEHSSQKLTPHKYWRDCSVWNGVFEPVPYPPHISALVATFCDAISESSAISMHTCCEFRWDAMELELRQCYAAAYLLLHPESTIVPFLEPHSRPVFDADSGHYDHCDESCPRKCVKCQVLLREEPVAPPTSEVAHITTSGNQSVLVESLSLRRVHNLESNGISDIPRAELEDKDDTVRLHSSLPFSLRPQIPPKSGRLRETTLSKDAILPKLKDHFAKLLGAHGVRSVLIPDMVNVAAQHDIPIQKTNLGVPQLPWCTLPQLLRNSRLEIAGWPPELPLPDATGKHNAKGIMGISAKDARRLYEALDGISFRKTGTRPREDENEHDIGFRPTKKAKGKGNAPAEGEKKFCLSEVQTVIRGIRVEKFD